MRHRRHTGAEEETEINLTPMLDVVFIMLIFFIVTTTFVREAGVKVNRPAAETAERREQQNILIAITEEGQVWIDKRNIDIRAIRANVERLKAESPDAAVIVQSDEAARTGVLVKVMDQVRLAGITNILVSAEKP